MKNAEELIVSLNRRLAHADAALAKWAERYAADAYEALQWTEKAIQAAAEKQVFSIAVEVLEDYEEDRFLDWLMSTALGKATYSNNSSDSVANAVKDAERTVWVQLLKEVKECWK